MAPFSVDGPVFVLAPFSCVGKSVGKPDAGNPHVRFDERGKETGAPRTALSSTLPVRARMARKATDWRWSSARAHCAGKDAGGVLCLDVWRHLFGNPAVAAEAWTTFLEGPEEEVRRNAGRRAVPYNRVAWSVPVVPLKAGSPPG